jgi:uncharacterized protein YhaN
LDYKGGENMEKTGSRTQAREFLEETKVQIGKMHHDEERLRQMLGMADLSESNRNLLQTQVDELEQDIAALESRVRNREAQLDADDAAAEAAELQRRAQAHLIALAEYTRKAGEAIKSGQPLPPPLPVFRP